MTTNQHALIIGGGIAGPALALFLKKAGIAATVFEAHPEPAATGGALGLAPNGMAVLAELGLAEAVRAAGSICAAFAFRTPAGKLLGTAPYGAPGRYGQPAVTLARAGLHEVLADAAERNGIAIERGKRLRDLAVDADGVTTRFDDGSSARGDFVVGADGIDSRVRAIMLPNGPKPEFTGLVGPGGFVLRSAIPIGRPGDEQTMVLHFAPGAFFGYGFGGRSGDAQAFWWTALERDRPLTEEERQAFSLDRVRSALFGSGQAWDAPVARIIDATTTYVPPLNLFDVATLPRWWQDRIVLVGDAAHAVSPHSGQGASVALEDALALARQLRDQRGTLDQAFAAFEAERRERCEKIVAYGRKSGNAKKNQGPVAKWLQRALLPLFIRFGGFDLDWMYGYRPQW